jgi:uncharacterized protein YdiU (UPF0061 family)
VQDLLDAMTKNQADFTLTFRRLGDAARGRESMTGRGLFIDPTMFDEWAVALAAATALEPQSAGERRDAMIASTRHSSRNHRVEAVIQAARAARRLRALRGAVGALAKPFEDVAGILRPMPTAARRASG